MAADAQARLCAAIARFQVSDPGTIARMGDHDGEVERTTLRPPWALRVGLLLLAIFAVGFTVLLGRDGEGTYWTQATSVLCMAVALFAGLVGLSVKLVLASAEIRVVNWTEQWRLPVTATLDVSADDGLYFSTARGKVRSACAQPSLLGGLTGYRRAQELRRRCLPVLDTARREAAGEDITRQWRWSLIAVFALAVLGLWTLYSAAYLLR